MQLSNPALMGKNPKTKTKHIDYEVVYQAIEPNGRIYAETANVHDFVEYVNEYKGNVGPEVLMIKRLTRKIVTHTPKEKKWTKKGFYEWLQK